MVSLKTSYLKNIIPDVLLTLIVATLASGVPFEKILSEYPHAPTYPWHIPWRMALGLFLLWLGAGLVFSFGYDRALITLIVSGLGFVAAHYWALLSLPASCVVTLAPLSYSLNCGKGVPLLYLDLGQVAIVITCISIIYKYKKAAEKGKAT